MSNNNDNGAADPSTRARRSSITAATFGSLFARSNSTAGTQPFPAAANQDQRRRMSISTVGLSGTSPTNPVPFGFGGRRGSVSTERSDSVDESAIDDDESSARSNPTTPFARRMSFGTPALRSRNGNASPGSNGRAPSYSTTVAPLPTIPAGSGGGRVSPSKAQASTQSKPRTTSDFPSRTGEGGFNWSEQLRSRAESAVSQTQRPNFSSNGMKAASERAKGIAEMPAPPVQAPAPAPAPVRQQRPKPDAFQERILKGDFYMD